MAITAGSIKGIDGPSVNRRTSEPHENHRYCFACMEQLGWGITCDNQWRRKLPTIGASLLAEVDKYPVDFRSVLVQLDAPAIEF
jgi:hypothetical protein